MLLTKMMSFWKDTGILEVEGCEGCGIVEIELSVKTIYDLCYSFEAER